MPKMRVNLRKPTKRTTDIKFIFGLERGEKTLRNIPISSLTFSQKNILVTKISAFGAVHLCEGHTRS